MRFGYIERRPSATSMELGTNNPFRARLSVQPPLSPASDSDHFSFQSSTVRERPVSRNPFLDVTDDDVFDFDTSQRPKAAYRANSFDTTRPALTGSAAELFVCTLATPLCVYVSDDNRKT